MGMLLPATLGMAGVDALHAAEAVAARVPCDPPAFQRVAARESALEARVAAALVGVECKAGAQREHFYGSGIVVAPNGIILSSATAVPEGAREIRVLLSDGRALEAEELERSNACESVLLKPRGRGAKDVRWTCLDAGDARAAQPGAAVFAAGNAHQTLGRDGQVYWSGGTLSGRFRETSDDESSRYHGAVLETDAAVNHGCDGGALVDGEGRLLGMLSLCHSKTRCLGTAIPLQEILAQMPRAAKAMQRKSNLPDAETPRAEDPVAETLRAAAARASKAVVKIRLAGSMNGAAQTERFATGVLVEPRGTILTSALNLEGAGARLDVVLADGRTFEAEARGRHLGLDVAVLQLKAPEREALPALSLAEAPELAAGDFVAVLGAPPDDGPGAATCTHGMVSALDRLEGLAVQVDARINLGNAGGPVVGLDGRLLGIATQNGGKKIWSQSSGVGFFAPAGRIKECLEALRRGQTLQPPAQAFLGVRPAVGETDLAGVKLAEVVEKSAAWRAGLRVGDVLTSLDGQDTQSWPAVIAALKKKAPGDLVEVRFMREEKAWKAHVALDVRAGE
ncbi:MAG: trypsin-like peptidase domain-containing protein [Planctomycetes bacterium]|nr:trypsin-like peptidase domain-containing protein [Planctomycetota bacterium]